MSILKNLERFTVHFMDDPEHEDLVTEVICDDDFFMLVDQESGIERMRLSIQPRPDRKPWSVSAQEFESLLAHIKIRLWELRRSDDID